MDIWGWSTAFSLTNSMAGRTFSLRYPKPMSKAEGVALETLGLGASARKALGWDVEAWRETEEPD